jgi:hypothetical protein
MATQGPGGRDALFSAGMSGIPHFHHRPGMKGSFNISAMDDVPPSAVFFLLRGIPKTIGFL